MDHIITAVETFDVRFPTSRALDGSDAIHPAPDYSAAYCILHTDGAGDGHGFTFTIGRGNDLCVAAIDLLAVKLIGRDLESMFSGIAQLARELTSDGQLRWLGPEKGVIHLATAAILNAVWDLYAKRRGVPVWRLVAEMPPEEIVKCIDFRYISDALSPEEALQMLKSAQALRAERSQQLEADGYPAYTTSAGWLGYPDEKLTRRVDHALAEGWTALKMKVGGDRLDDLRRVRTVRDRIGPETKLALDANQIWGVEEAIVRIRELGAFSPWWIEEPTSPDDVLGHARIARAVAPIRIATGEHAHNRVMFKQLFQANAISICQIDSCRVASVNENLAIMLMAAKFGVPVCPHAGGVGLCELVQHLAFIDFVAISGRLDGRMIEFADHLHEHFVTPVDVRRGRYYPPSTPGFGTELLPGALSTFSYPAGMSWNRAAVDSAVLP